MLRLPDGRRHGKVGISSGSLRMPEGGHSAERSKLRFRGDPLRVIPCRAEKVSCSEGSHAIRSKQRWVISPRELTQLLVDEINVGVKRKVATRLFASLIFLLLAGEPQIPQALCALARTPPRRCRSRRLGR